MKTVTIGGKNIGKGHPVFVVAEAGVNHNGSLPRALEHIRKAKEAGADAIKFQTYKAEKLVTKKARKYWNVGDDDLSQFETFSKFDEFPAGHYRKMIQYGKKIGITVFSTPFDLDAVDLLEEAGVPAYKISSSDITFFPMLRKIAKTKKPIILSTGASSVAEIRESVKYIRSFGNDKIILLQCVLAYPTRQSDAHLLMIDALQKTFPGVPVGLSDHTFSPLTPALAVMRGACAVEKHYTVDKSLPDSPDHKLGVDSAELRVLVDAVRLAEESLGQMKKEVLQSEMPARRLARKSVTSRVAIQKGTRIGPSMLIGKRPGTGIPTKYMESLTGRRAKKNIPEDTTMTWEMVSSA